MNKLIFITGATSGIGEAAARLFAQAGDDLILTGRRSERLLSLAKELEQTCGVEVRTLCFDVRDQKEGEKNIGGLTGKWRGIDVLINNAGLAAGLGLAALFSHLGLGEEMANFMMLALLAMAALMLFRLFTRRNAPAPAMQYAGMPQNSPTAFDPSSAAFGGSRAVGSFPPGFDAAAFAREAKLNFIRLQAAFDARNLDDIRAFTAPEIFAEISMQLAERGDARQTTDVLTLDAEVLEAIDEGNRHIVSVRFTGLVREDADAAPVALDEVWHLSKPAGGLGGWLIAGIQQQ